MNDLEIAALKDDILNYLIESPTQPFELYFIKNNVPEGILNACVEEMDRDDVLTYLPVEDGRIRIISITGKGRIFLASGGYAKPIQEQEADKKRDRELTELNIDNLRWTKWLSIIAAIISLAALAVSILK